MLAAAVTEGDCAVSGRSYSKAAICYVLASTTMENCQALWRRFVDRRNKGGLPRLALAAMTAEGRCASAEKSRENALLWYNILEARLCLYTSQPDLLKLSTFVDVFSYLVL